MGLHYTEVDVFIGSNTIIDEHIYTCWLDGYTPQETAILVKEKECIVLRGIHDDLIISDVLDQYRLFGLIERLLQSPSMIGQGWSLQINAKTRRLLIEKYYEFDDCVVREILGKKLSSRNRTELKDVSEKTSVGLKSCRRQFDNVKRVYKAVEDMGGNLIFNIQNNFLLSERLAKRYATVVYIANNRFETSKRKINYLKFADFYHCAYQMMTNWSCKNPECKYEESPMDIDREFLQDLRELKVLLEREYMDEHKINFMRELKSKSVDRMDRLDKQINDLDSLFKNTSRSIINIAFRLNQGKEVRDLFLDIVDKIIEPFKAYKLVKSDLEVFLQLYMESPKNMEVFVRNPDLWVVWLRYMRTLNSCIIQMYH
ncbi:acidic fibroblast growth factor intracellular-binding protein B [Tetranychus urticae]|uniref:Acidic fibroblast growth factor intracellular-binding protein n=1 Tax=Tetranychus urticae TaxID=32264 RepID=T1L1D9_TETUR|nr:acidic fibroblast growth factor intracellular-binding protein B [Tetranychus urticae]